MAVKIRNKENLMPSRLPAGCFDFKHIKRVIVACVLWFVVVSVYGVSVDYDGDVRSRFVGMLQQQPLATNALQNAGILDSRLRLGFKITDKGLPWYGYYKMEVGNLTWGDDFSGGAVDADGINVETKNLFVGYRDSMFDIKAGILPFAAPGKAVIDTDLAGLDGGFVFGSLHGEVLYSRLLAGDVTNESVDIGDLQTSATNFSHLGFADLRYDFSKDISSDIFYMMLYDTLNTNRLTLHWIGFKQTFQYSFPGDAGFSLSGDAALTWNLGSLESASGNSSSPVTVNACFMYAKLELTTPWADVMFRVNRSSGNTEGQTNEIHQFQVINNSGKLDTDLGILFGGSSFDQQSYFDSDISTLRRKNLTTGDIVYNDPGLFVIEGGLSGKFDFYTVSLVGGIGMTTESLSNQNLLGIELDLHNKFRLSKNSTLRVSLAYLFPGDLLETAYQLNHKNADFQGNLIVYKIDGEVEMRF